MAKQFTLGKKERLKSRKQIDLLFSKGKKLTVTPLLIYYQFSRGKNIQPRILSLQFGTGVSGKNFKRAVDRNRIKRLIRETWRLQNDELKKKIKEAGIQVNVFFIYTGKDLPDFTLVKDKVAVALKKLSDKIDENNTSDS